MMNIYIVTKLKLYMGLNDILWHTFYSLILVHRFKSLIPVKEERTIRRFLFWVNILTNQFQY